MSAPVTPADLAALRVHIEELKHQCNWYVNGTCTTHACVQRAKVKKESHSACEVRPTCITEETVILLYRILAEIEGLQAEHDILRHQLAQARAALEKIGYANMVDLQTAFDADDADSMVTAWGELTNRLIGTAIEALAAMEPKP